MPVEAFADLGPWASATKVVLVLSQATAALSWPVDFFCCMLQRQSSIINCQSPAFSFLPLCAFQSPSSLYSPPNLTPNPGMFAHNPPTGLWPNKSDKHWTSSLAPTRSVDFLHIPAAMCHETLSFSTSHTVVQWKMETPNVVYRMPGLLKLYIPESKSVAESGRLVVVISLGTCEREE